jgi:Caspase domain
LAIRTRLALTIMLACAASQGTARDWGIVVGIDDYQNFIPFDPAVPTTGHFDLQGAVNDASVIRDALRAEGVDLPDSRVLLDQAGTLAAFQAAWAEVTAQAAPGDTIFVTYAGHGGQEREASEPMDEADGMDETLMFADFDPANPRAGRLNDDQLQQMLGSVPQFQIIWVMDSCHSAGLERSISPKAAGLSRSGGVWDIPVDPLPTEAPSGAGDSAAPVLPNVTQILATATEDLLVQETAFDGQPHGALSWFFAKGIAGEADQNSDGALTRLELSSFVGDRVFTHMEQNQQPKFVPRGDTSVMLSLDRGIAIEKAPSADQLATPGAGLPIRLVGAPPPGIDASHCPGCRLVDQGHALQFQQSATGWEVFSGQGDRITSITTDAAPQIARAQFLVDINAAKVATLPPVAIKPLQSAARQPLGAEVGFEFRPPTSDLAFVTLFNVASDGTVQYPIYPPGFNEADAVTDALSLRFAVAPPTGEDQLVTIWCARPPLGLHELLNANNGQTVPTMQDVLSATADTICQYGRIGLFTEG